jgi:protein farnesyltransferase subunit beta
LLLCFFSSRFLSSAILVSFLSFPFPLFLLVFLFTHCCFVLFFLSRGYPGNEAHGGYTFCAFAALAIIGRTEAIDNMRLLSWAVKRQLPLEGGFQGRTNKLVDSCYSYWQGGIFPILDQVLDEKPLFSASEMDGESWLFLQKKLQQYILMCCQNVKGGLKDKPRKNCDYYHTCYALSGLSIAQHNRRQFRPIHCILGPPENLLLPTHSLHNIHPFKVEAAHQYFSKLPPITKNHKK